MYAGVRSCTHLNLDALIHQIEITARIPTRPELFTKCTWNRFRWRFFIEFINLQRDPNWFNIINLNKPLNGLFGIFRTAFLGDFSNFCELGEIPDAGWKSFIPLRFWEYCNNGRARILSSFELRGSRLILPPKYQVDGFGSNFCLKFSTN